MSNILFDDIFTVESSDSARYNKVCRITGQSSTAPDVKLTLDINSELFPVQANESITVTLASSLSLDGADPAQTNTSWRPPKADERSLADDYDYVMHGTVYKFEESANDKTSVYISFGGLLMCLEGGYRNLSNLKQANAYILIRR
ncbi:hypothetical protein BABINDRAFT_47941 [Babjeviella inositovora NRRL Y-12698]|uniref:DNA-directed RNA polymerases I, II, and III subunit RPABC3 n=1 Tax=Babjeviella inositovora NRRL Y-12698 TaxID=984486 RepID=A0A1E3QUQ3_9ASCO|nr:uncharacterized protein BABINDRAFT_47941 [Babjeviella inositovora NRRL Y-12698]ODQ80732.1 hypothetical protein BABINDRAFT_47941 [Babjeviella inositovora NRRL Y-12698]